MKMSSKEKKAFRMGIGVGALNACAAKRCKDKNTGKVLSASEVARIVREYGHTGMTTQQCLGAYANHMRIKYGVYNRNTGKRIGWLGGGAKDLKK